MSRSYASEGVQAAIAVTRAGAVDFQCMNRTVTAVIDEHGNVRLLEPVQLPAARPALVMILEGRAAQVVSVGALLSEAALAQDWNRPEEDEAWSHLQPPVR